MVPFESGRKLVEGIEPVRKKLVGKLSVLETKCAYCSKWFAPHPNNFYSRISCLAGRNQGESRLYCSDNCKRACPVYMQKSWPKNHKPATSREVQPELRQMVLERDNWTCQYGTCGKTVDDAELHCHHIEGININPIESADMDMCITLCKEHHKKVHTEEGCKYFQLKCEDILDK